MLLSVLAVVSLGRWGCEMRCANLEGSSVLARTQAIPPRGASGGYHFVRACRDLGGRAVKAGGMVKAATH